MRCEKCGKEVSRYQVCSCGAKSSEWAVIQLETNGLKPEEKAQILRIVMLDNHCNVIWNRYYRPTLLSKWEEAERVNGIGPDVVAKAPVLRGKEIEGLVSRFSKYSFLVTNQVSFVQSFLNAAGVEHPKLIGISDLFENYMMERSIPRMNVSLNNCAAFFRYSTKDVPEGMAGFEKAYKIWYCYQNLAIIQKDEVIRVMGEEVSTGEYSYKKFLNEDQVLDYLKSIRVARIWERGIPRLFYDGKFYPEPTCDLFLLGLSFRPSADETKYVVDRIFFDMKGETIAMKEEAFIKMQERNREEPFSPYSLLSNF